MNATAFADNSVESIVPDELALAALATIGTSKQTRVDSAVPTGFPTTTCVTWACQ